MVKNHFLPEKVFKKIGLNKAIGLTVVTRILQAGGAVISLGFIARFLTPTEQGYYYTFSSILAIQIFFELGLSGIITQYASHEVAHLNWTSAFELTGPDESLSRLSSLLHFCIKWFSVLFILLFVVLIVSGFVFFSNYKSSGIKIDWRAPWVLLSFSTSLSLIFTALLAFIEGLNKVSEVATIRLIQQIVQIVLLLSMFVFGCKLYSQPVANLAGILVAGLYMFFSGYITLLKNLFVKIGVWRINYLKEIFPYQWKIALSWISGYFVFQLFNPVLFATEGPAVAGQMGMTLAALNGVSSLSISWIYTKVSLFSSLIAKKKYVELDTVFKDSTKSAVGINMLLIGFFITLIFLLKRYLPSIGNRFLSLFPLILLSITVVANQFIFSWAIYLRCHKKEPFLLLSFVIGIFCLLSTFFLGKVFGLIGLVTGYTCITLMAVVWAQVIFEKKKYEWHRE